MSERIKHFMLAEQVRVFAAAASSISFGFLGFVDVALKIAVSVLTIIYLVRKLRKQRGKEED